MSFRYGGRFVALDNYKQFFEECSPDVLDEIRSAVLDDTDISQYIDACGDDSYLLGQIRIAIREHIPEDYLDTRLTGKTIYNVRQGIANGRDMSAILWYITPQKLKVEKEIIQMLSDFCLLGTDISRVDFTLVPKNLVPIFCKGLYKGYPMWLLSDECAGMNVNSIQVLMRGMELGIDVQPFMRGGWSKEALLLIFSYAKACDINALLGYLNSKFDIGQLKVLLDIASSGIPISRLCMKDSSGAPVYNQYQMYELGESLKLGLDVKQMFNPRLSDYDMAQMRTKILEARQAGN